MFAVLVRVAVSGNIVDGPIGSVTGTYCGE
jgi:hypothetical protein